MVATRKGTEHGLQTRDVKKMPESAPASFDSDNFALFPEGAL